MDDASDLRPRSDAPAWDAADIAERTRRSLIDLQQAIATLRELDLGDIEPAIQFDPTWPEDA